MKVACRRQKPRVGAQLNYWTSHPDGSVRMWMGALVDKTSVQ
jgi:hypothetical protein